MTFLDSFVFFLYLGEAEVEKICTASFIALAWARSPRAEDSV
jgi:hypothetical protein